ncbi:MAG: tRNA (adenosine(37)-N6)-dimethylallyltransferase MiaA [Lysobacterales bacterium]|jgi:tRNA dimethylallyltransferase
MPQASLPRAVFLMGPTAAGKTGLAIELHKRYGLEIVNVDSAQVYRGLDIGSAKPDAATLRAAPHRLIDIRDASESYSAAEFRDDALREMEAITAAGRVPLLAGGTMLYFRALEHGLSVLPSADAEVREEIERQAAELGWAALHDMLRQKDPEAAQRIHPNDPQRIQRALEVIALSGRPLSELQKQVGQALEYRLLKVVVCPEPRSVLHERIAQRFDQMLAGGFIDELKTLHAREDLHPGLPSMRAVGYRQGWGWLEGEYGFEEMREKAIAATRQLAKRQLTWLRREDGALWYDLQADGAAGVAVQKVGEFLED